MKTFSQSQIIEADYTLAVSSYPSTISPISIIDEVTKVLKKVLKNTTKSKQKRPTG
jgi:hypothetical protein